MSANYVGNKFSSSVSNCITEIPQDIKVELNNGVLTLKAGSKLWYPDGLNDGGSKKFNPFICPSDLVLQGAETGIGAAQRTVVIDTETYNWTYRYLSSSVYSGDTAPAVSSQYALWYDTSANLIKRTTDTGASWTTTKTSFPICIYTRQEGGTVSGVDWVFNGFGYIGSTAFALPGVKVRIPNGVDANGTPKYRPFEVETVMIYTIPANENYAGKFYLGDLTEWGLTEFELFRAGDAVTLRLDSNLYYDTVTGRFCSWLPIASALLNDGVISQFVPYTVDPAVDGNMTNISKAGRSVLSGVGMPSNRYVDLTLGASGSTYTAPANGWFSINGNDNNSIGTYNIVLRGTTASVGRWFGVTAECNNKSAAWTGCILPVRRGQTANLYYSNVSTSSHVWRFYYAEGEI